MTLASGDKNNWIPNTSGKSCGIQGAFYAYDDGKSITTPAATTGSEKETPCVKDGTKVKCCIKGATTATAADWGGGLGIDLNSNSGTKGAYSGAAKGFKFTLAGTFGASMKLRIQYQTTTTKQTTDPFKEVAAAAGDFSVLFADVKCPTDWGADATCTAASTTPYAFKIQVVGGTAASAFDFCLTSMTPL